MPRSQRVKFLVSLERPDGASIEDLREYIAEAIAVYRGSLRPPGGYDDDDPGDPLFMLDRDKIKVILMERGD
jgi:hypothetical protein